MKALACLTALFCSCVALTVTALAGPESSGKEMKQVAPAPLPECNWTGFHIGLNIGGNFGHAENTDLSDYNFPDKPWGYSTSGVIAGGQIGYDYQWNWLLLGVEADFGYMDINGSGDEPGSPDLDTRGHSDSDFMTTIRGRLGLAWNKWLFYGTGGGIGVNWETRVNDDCITFPCGGTTIDAHKQDFEWGWTVGGGLEYMINCHWTIRAEYLYYELDDRTFDGEQFIRGVVPNGRFDWAGRAEGNIVRGALNYKF